MTSRANLYLLLGYTDTGNSRQRRELFHLYTAGSSH